MLLSKNLKCVKKVIFSIPSQESDHYLPRINHQIFFPVKKKKSFFSL